MKGMPQMWKQGTEDMTANATQSAPLLDIEIVELPQKCLPYPEEEDHVVAGYGACYACKAEGHPERCGGFVNDNKGQGNCKTCGHNFSRHA